MPIPSYVCFKQQLLIRSNFFPEEKKHRAFVKQADQGLEIKHRRHRTHSQWNVGTGAKLKEVRSPVLALKVEATKCSLCPNQEHHWASNTGKSLQCNFTLLLSRASNQISCMQELRRKIFSAAQRVRRMASISTGAVPFNGLQFPPPAAPSGNYLCKHTARQASTCQWERKRQGLLNK